jgi:hypothetical protein
LESLIFENCQQVDEACQTGHFLEEENFSLKKESKMEHLETELENKILDYTKIR